MLFTNQPYTIIDVGTPDDYAKAHVPGALNIPWEEIPTRLREVSEMPRPIITYCRSGYYSSEATSYLKQQGIDEVFNGGGIWDMLRSAQ